MTIRRTLVAAVAGFTLMFLPAGVQAGGRTHVTRSAAVSHWMVLVGSSFLQRPSGLAIDLRGNPQTPKWAYTADAGTGRIVKFGTGGTVLGGWTYTDPAHGGPASVAVGGTGNVFVADAASGTVLKFTPNGTLVRRWEGFQDPRGITVDRSGTIYVSEYRAHRVTVLSPGGAVQDRLTTEAIFSPGGSASPTGVALYPPDSLYLTVTCAVKVTCGPGSDTNLPSDMVDGILQFIVQGPRRGYLRQNWYGIGHSVSGVPQGYPDKESEPFVTLDAMTSDRIGNLYIAGLLWERGGQPTVGVMKYSALGSKGPILPLPGGGTIRGIAVDGRGAVYVSRGSHILKRVRR